MDRLRCPVDFVKGRADFDTLAMWKALFVVLRVGRSNDVQSRNSSGLIAFEKH